MSNPMNSQKSSVRCGLAPARSPQYWNMTTKDVEKFISNGIIDLEEQVRTQLIKEKKNPDLVKPAKPKLITIQLGKNFFPFFLTFRDSVLLEHGGANNNIPEMFRPELNDGGVSLKNMYWRFISGYLYSKEDVKQFQDPQWKREMRITNIQSFRAMSKYARPKVETIETANGKTTSVVVMLDPLRVWKYMLFDTNYPNENYVIYPESVEQLSDGTNYKFELRREVTEREIRGVDVQKILRRTIMNIGR